MWLEKIVSISFLCFEFFSYRIKIILRSCSCDRFTHGLTEMVRLGFILLYLDSIDRVRNLDYSRLAMM